MRVLAAMLAAWMLVALSACAQPQDQPDPQPEPDVQEEPVQPDPPPPSPEELAAAQIEELLSSLTLEEQVGQLFFVRCPADQALEDITTYHLGGYVLFTRDYQDDSGAWLTKEQFVRPSRTISPPPWPTPASPCSSAPTRRAAPSPGPAGTPISLTRFSAPPKKLPRRPAMPETLGRRRPGRKTAPCWLWAST